MPPHPETPWPLSAVAPGIESLGWHPEVVGEFVDAEQAI
jgi:hypothetical protein